MPTQIIRHQKSWMGLTMNTDLIRRLEKQCWNYQANCLDAEKFAESIVQDCVGVVNVWSDEQPCSEGYDILTVSKIKQHFGVD
jgi:hypothetical protein